MSMFFCMVTFYSVYMTINNLLFYIINLKLNNILLCPICYNCIVKKSTVKDLKQGEGFVTSLSRFKITKDLEQVVENVTLFKYYVSCRVVSNLYINLCQGHSIDFQD